MVILDSAPIFTVEISSSTVVHLTWGLVGSWLFLMSTEDGGMGHAPGQGTSVTGALEVSGPHPSKLQPASLSTTLCPQVPTFTAPTRDSPCPITLFLNLLKSFFFFNVFDCAVSYLQRV